jgi:hypothetical protein
MPYKVAIATNSHYRYTPSHDRLRLQCYQGKRTARGGALREREASRCLCPPWPEAQMRPMPIVCARHYQREGCKRLAIAQIYPVELFID